MFSKFNKYTLWTRNLKFWSREVCREACRPIALYSIKTTTDFANLLNRTLEDDEVLLSLDVSSFFTWVPLNDTIDHIIEEIYTHN